MNYSRWLKITLLFTAFLMAITVGLNIMLDTYGAYLNLFNKAGNTKYHADSSPIGLNQRISIPEFIFHNPERYNSFLFGTSRVSVIDTGKITTGRFYNMSYPQGIPAEHLAVIKTFLARGIKIKNIIIGLDEFSFKSDWREHENQLLMIMHPDISGKNRLAVFVKFFFRLPRPFELTDGFKHFVERNNDLKTNISETGLNLGWLNWEKEITATGKPLFSNGPFAYSPYAFDRKLVHDVFSQIEEMKALAIKHNFSLIFFFNPIHAQSYANYAADLLPIKKELADRTGFYDFSGFNSITTNNINYYETQHFRYAVGDMMIEKIFSNGKTAVPDDFGVLINKNNAGDLIHKQNLALEKYLAGRGIKTGM